MLLMVRRSLPLFLLSVRGVDRVPPNIEVSLVPTREGGSSF